MTDRDALFATVLDNPADDTARLVLADWLEEHSEEPLGRFLRAGVVASHFRGTESTDAPDALAARKVLVDLANEGVPARWLAALGIGSSPLTPIDWWSEYDHDRVTVHIGAAAGVFTRGMLSELVVPLDGWYECAASALADWPLERATITDVPGLRFWVVPTGGGSPSWRLMALVSYQPPARRRGLLGRLGSALGIGGSEHWGVHDAQRLYPDRASLTADVRRRSELLAREAASKLPVSAR